MLENVKIPDLIVDKNELLRLELEVALSKRNNLEEEKEKEKKVGIISNSKDIVKKKKKKRPRYPKNFDPKNPGNPPNPERWLPKQERKDYKKKKPKGRTQGVATSGTETTGKFQTGISTANQEVSTAVKKGAKKSSNKKKR